MLLIKLLVKFCKCFILKFTNEMACINNNISVYSSLRMEQNIYSETLFSKHFKFYILIFLISWWMPNFYSTQIIIL